MPPSSVALNIDYNNRGFFIGSPLAKPSPKEWRLHSAYFFVCLKFCKYLMRPFLCFFQIFGCKVIYTLLPNRSKCLHVCSSYRLVILGVRICTRPLIRMLLPLRRRSPTLIQQPDVRVPRRLHVGVNKLTELRGRLVRFQPRPDPRLASNPRSPTDIRKIFPQNRKNL